MKQFTIVLPDEQAAALDRAVIERDFATPSDLIVTAIEQLLSAPFAYDPDALARDIAEHQAEKARGEVGYSPEEARAWLAAQRSA
jgi:Arc/MetJ-type ribon-helix-helix transcriptional regulator